MRKEKLQELKSLVEELKVVEFEEINTSKNFLKSKTYNFKLNNGMIIPREKLIKGNNDGSAVVVMPVLSNNEILTTVEPRVFTKLTVGIGFPAGYIEKDELPKVAALRELKEETGFVPKKITEVDAFYQDEGVSSAYNHLFIGYDCAKQTDQDLDEYEIVKYMTFNYDELFELENMGYIKGCNSKLLLEKSKVYMKGR